MKLPTLGLFSVPPKYNERPGGRGKIIVPSPPPKDDAEALSISRVKVYGGGMFPWLYTQADDPSRYPKMQNMMRSVSGNRVKNIPGILLLNSAPSFVIEPEYRRTTGNEYWVREKTNLGKEVPQGWNIWQYRQAKNIIQKLKPHYEVKQEKVFAVEERSENKEPFAATRFVLSRKTPIALNIRGGAAINERGVVTAVEDKGDIEGEIESLYNREPAIRDKYETRHPINFLEPVALVEPKVYTGRGRLFSNVNRYQGHIGYSVVGASKKKAIEDLIANPIVPEKEREHWETETDPKTGEKRKVKYISALPDDPDTYTGLIIASNARGELIINEPNEKKEGYVSYIGAHTKRSGTGTKTIEALFEKYPDTKFRLSSEAPAYRFWRSVGAEARPLQQEKIKKAYTAKPDEGFGSQSIEMTLTKEGFEKAQEKRMLEQLSEQSKQPKPVHYDETYGIRTYPGLYSPEGKPYRRKNPKGNYYVPLAYRSEPTEKEFEAATQLQYEGNWAGAVEEGKRKEGGYGPVYPEFGVPLSSSDAHLAKEAKKTVAREYKEMLKNSLYKKVKPSEQEPEEEATEYAGTEEQQEAELKSLYGEE